MANTHPNTWGDKVGQYSKAIVAGATSSVAFVTALIDQFGADLPSEVLVYVSGGTAAVTAGLTWLVSNTPMVVKVVDSTEDLIEDVLDKDV